MRFSSLALVLALVSAPMSVPVQAQGTSPEIQKIPNISGFWSPEFGVASEDREQDLLDKLPEGSAMVDDTGILEFPRGEFGELILKPETLAKAQTWQADDEMTLQRVCLSPSIVYSLQGPFPFEVHQTPSLIVIKYEYFDQTRLIHMDGREHPGDDYPHSKMGHSIGHWEGDELVIDTTHISASTITNNGLDHSENIRTIERYRLEGEGDKRLIATQWFSDRDVLENDGARYMSWAKREGEHVYPYECDPSFALEYQSVGE